ncbi:hypothetical protein HDU79_008063 [Rhizoclosmatium sp. JEL0117]|nr:hypothetical protein HDU79_008063 [Rhizoclosmatium sp. JEL0117]
MDQLQLQRKQILLLLLKAAVAAVKTAEPEASAPKRPCFPRDPTRHRTILDSGASCWMTPYKEDFITLQLVDNGGSISTASNSKLPIMGHGTVAMTFGAYEHHMDALYVPGLHEPLASVSGITNETRGSVSFEQGRVYLVLQNGFRYLIANRVGDLYYLLSSDTSDTEMDSDSGKRK